MTIGLDREDREAREARSTAREGTLVRLTADEGSEIDVAGLFREHRLRLVRMALLVVDDLASAEDVVQDAFAGLHSGCLRDPQAALAYVQRSVMNGCRSALRRRRTVRAHLRVADPDEGAPADVGVLLADEHVRILAAVRTSPSVINRC